MKSTIKTKSLPLLAALTLMSSSLALADDGRHLSATYPFEGQKIVLDVEVGEARIVAGDGQEVRVEVEVEGTKRSLLAFWQRKEVGDVALRPEIDPRQIKLSVNKQEDISQIWTVYLPREAKVEVQFGVGEVEVEGLENDLDINVGVGSVRVSHKHDYRDIALESGVGEVTFHKGHTAMAVKRNVVSQSFKYQGEGLGILDVNVGVGEVDVRQVD